MTSHNRRTVATLSMLVLSGTLLGGCGSAKTGTRTAAVSDAPTTTTTTEPARTATTTEMPTETTTTTEKTARTTSRTSRPATPNGTYRGSASVTLTSYDLCGPNGQPRAIGTQNYSAPAELYISAPKGNEQNPFSIAFQAGSLGSPGSVSLASSAVATTSGTDIAGNPRDPRLLLIYWRLNYSSGHLTGQLVDAHAREGAQPNLFNGIKLLIECRPELGTLPGGFPSAIDPGATLAGTLTGSAADLTVEAAADGGRFSFRMRFRT